MTGALDHWFTTEILPHEAALTRYLRRACLNAAEVADLRQEIYVRIYESASGARPTSARAFLFATARNLITDRVRRERVVSIEYTQDLDALNLLIDEISSEQRLHARQELKRLALALDELPDDCRNVIWLRRIEGLSQKEACERLGMLEGTLESHLCRGLRALMKSVYGTGGIDPPESARGPAKENEHG